MAGSSRGFDKLLGSDLETARLLSKRADARTSQQCQITKIPGLKSYYDTLSFFYWEPQHIGRKKYVDPQLKAESEVQNHVRTMEVTLNHQIKQFLTLAPGSFRNCLFKSALGRQVMGHFVMAGSDACKLCAAVQPDFLFMTDNSTVSLEMRVGAKSSVTQVLKYVLLALAVEQKHGGREMEHSLIFLGPEDFSRLWRERFSEVELRQALESERIPFILGLSGKERAFREQESRFAEIISSLSIGFINYSHFANLLYEEFPSPDGSAGEEVYRNLLHGMIAELKRRVLVR
jgi:hypothetical protein